jgi:ParB-like chromosome segregation protein Spo0J
MIKPIGTEDKLLEWFTEFDERELARHSDPEKNRLLGANMQARGQLQDVAATEKGRMIFGHARWLAAKAVGIKTLRTRIYPTSLTDTERELIKGAENLLRNDWTAYQKWQYCMGLMCGNPTWQQKDLVREVNLDAGQITRILSPSKCIQEIQDALKEGKVSISDCYACSKLEPMEQRSLLALKLSGATRDDLERAGKAKRNGNGQANTVRVEKVPVALPGGRKVIISGEGLGMNDVVDALGEALKEARKSADTFDVKTWVKMMADKAKG